MMLVTDGSTLTCARYRQAYIGQALIAAVKRGDARMMRAREALLRGDAKGGLDHFFRHSPSGGEAAWWMQEEKNRFTLYAYPHLRAIAVAASEMPECPDEEFCARLAANASWVVSMGYGETYDEATGPAVYAGFAHWENQAKLERAIALAADARVTSCLAFHLQERRRLGFAADEASLMNYVGMTVKSGAQARRLQHENGTGAKLFGAFLQDKALVDAAGVKL